MVCLWLHRAGVAICGLSSAAQSRRSNLWSVCGCTEQERLSVVCLAAQSRKGNLWSVCGCTEQAWQSVVCLWLHRAGVAICGLSVAAQSRRGNLWSVCGCTEQAWQSVVCLWLHRAGVAICGLQPWQSVACLWVHRAGLAICGLVCLWLHRAGLAICGLSVGAQSRKAICGLSSASWRGNSNVCVWLFRAEIVMSLSGCLEQGYQCLFLAAWRQWSNQ